ncbi:MAG: AAA-like domain-containing protein [Gammaproteobacteria bacterium]|nr:AAA-like domain-containing protein [Gammaproteobacteria bacterium]
MPSNSDKLDFFVVGGPVLPGRACYLPRPADAQMLRFLDMGESCTLFMPRQCGKTSLINHCAQRLRKDGRLAAIVDLTQMGTLEHSDEPSRWFYTIAHRILRDLRLKINLQQWWRDHSGLSNQERMADFFWEILLGNTTAPIVIFFDDLETLIELPSAREFLATIRASNDRRASEPDFQRLSFVLAGVTHPIQFKINGEQAPFEVCYPVVLEDFSLQDLQAYAGILDPDSRRAGIALARVHYWTAGQPYLTQKICRSIVRQGLGEDVETSVDTMVESLFLQANSGRTEPHLNAIRQHLSTRDDKRNTVMTLFGRIRKGSGLSFDPSQRSHVELLLSGMIRVDDEGLMQIRNRIYRAQFTARWVNQSLPLNWRGIARGLATAALVLFLPYWYTQLLPSPYIRALSSGETSFEDADRAYAVLRRIPGYRDTALRLYHGFLVERGQTGSSLTLVREATGRLEKELGDSEVAEYLIGGFWGRRAIEVESLEDRDASLLFRLRALEMDASRSRKRIDALVADDYGSLVSTIRPAGRLDRAMLSADGGTLVTVESGNLVRRWDTATGKPREDLPLGVYAQEFVPLARQLVVAQPGALKDLELRITLNHFRPDDLAVILTAPSGKSVSLPLSLAGEARDVDYIFNTATYALNGSVAKQFRQFAGELREGTWTLSLEDREEGVTGTLVAWGLQFSPKSVEMIWDTPDAPVQIQDPRNTDQVRVELGPAGRLAAAVSAYDDPRGYILTWDLLGREELARIPEAAGASTVIFAMQGEALVVAGANASTVSVRDARSGALRFELDGEGILAVPPVLSADGRFLLLAAQRKDQGSSFSVFDLARGKRVHALNVDASVTHVALAPGGARIAAAFRDNLVRVWDLAPARILAELFHTTPVTDLIFDVSGHWLLMGNRDRKARGWNLRSLAGRSPPPDVVLDNRDGQSMFVGMSPGQVVVQDRPGSVLLLDLGQRSVHTHKLRHGPGVTGSDSGLSQPLVPGQGLFSGFSLDSSRLFTAQHGGIVRVWDLQAGKLALPGAALSAAPETLAISPDGNTLAWGNKDGEVSRKSSLSDTQSSGMRTQITKGHAAPINFIRYSGNGEFLVSAAEDGSLRVWEQGGEGASVSFRNDLGVLQDAQISDDGLVLAGSGAYGVRVWNARTGEPRFDVASLGSAPVIALRHDGRQLLVQGNTADLQLRDATTGELLQAISTGKGIQVARFSPDDRFVILSDQGGDLSVWRSQDYSLAGRPLHLGGEVVKLAFVPGGNALVARTHNWVHLLALTSAGLSVRASRLAEMPGGSNSLYFPDRSGQQMVFASADQGGEPVAMKMYFDARENPDIQGDADSLLSDLSKRLGLAIGEDGSLAPAAGGEPIHVDVALVESE